MAEESHVQVIPIDRSVSMSADITMILVSVDLYSSLLGVRYSLFRASASDATLGPVRGWKVTDNLGTEYRREGGSGGGDKTKLFMDVRFMPGRRPGLQRLTIQTTEVPSLKLDINVPPYVLT